MKKLIALIITLFCIITAHGKQDTIKLHVTKGKFRAYVSLGWNKIPGFSKYEIYRSSFKYGRYTKLTTNKDGWYFDATVTPGHLYWYKIRGRGYYKVTPFSKSVSGYSYIKEPQGASLNRLMKLHNRNMPRVNSSMKAYRNKQIKIIKNNYTNFFELSFVLFLAKPYLKDRRLVLFTNYDYMTINRKKASYYFIKKNKYIIKIQSNSLKAIHQRCLKHKKAGVDLFNKLMNNIVLYSMYKGNIPQKTKSGQTIMVPYYEALGLTTEYYNRYKHWRFNTMLLGTSNSRLRKEMTNIKKGRKRKRY